MCKLRFSHEFIMHVPKLLLGSEARGASIAIPKPPANDGFPVGCAEARGASIAVAQPSAIAMPSANDGLRKLSPSYLMLVPKLLLGNAVFEAPASRQDGKQELVEDGLPSWSLGTSGFVLFLLLTLLCLTTPMLAHAATAVGATPGSFKVNETGAATYTIPITVPPGTGGMAPTLSLNYNSQSGNGPLGVGWSLGGLSAITRCPASYAQDGFKGGINYDGNDRYCLDGQRLVAVSGAYGADGAEYRTETESYTRVVSYGSAGNGPAWFKAWTKSGQIMEYGNTADSRIEAQGKPTVRVWAVDKISDTKSNYIAVSYLEDNANGEFNLNRIDYTGNAAAGVAPYASVQLSYEIRPDIIIGYEVGSLIKNTKRIINIKTYNSSTLTKDHRIAYTQSHSSQNSRVTALIECTGDGTCLPATLLAWQDTSMSFSPMVLESNSYGTGSGWSDNNTYLRTMADVNGDGKADIIGFRNTGVAVSLATGSGFTAETLWVGAYGTNAGWSNSDTFPRMMADVNGDGKADVVGFRDTGVAVSLSTGTSFTAEALWVGAYGRNAGWSSNNIYPRMMADVNGDGKADVVGFRDTGVAVSLSTGTSFTAEALWVGAYGNNAGWSSNNIYPRMMADVNGDGKADVVGFRDTGVAVSLSTGSSFTAEALWVSAYGNNAGWSNNNTYPRMLIDVNGDGKADVVGFRDTGVAVSLSTGSSFTAEALWVGAYGTNAGWSDNNTYLRTLIDVNGDNKADVVGFRDTGVAVSLSTGTSFTAEALWVGAFGTNAGWSDNNKYPRIMSDVNGDGKADVVGFSSQGVDVSTEALPPVDLVASITNGLGPITTITYKPITDLTVYTKDTTSTYPYLDFQGPLYVVSKTQTSDGIGGNYATNYTYAGAKLHELGGGFLGFRQLIVNDPQTGITTTASYSQNYPYQGLPQTVVKQAANGQILNSAQNTWQTTSLGGGAYHRSDLVQTNEQSWDLNGTAMPRTQTNTVYDGYGNATQIRVATDDGYNSAGPVSPFGNVKTTTNTYSNDTTNWLLGRLTRATVTSSLPTGLSATRTSAFAYDPASGLLTQEIIEPDNASLKLTTTYTLDAFGNRVASSVNGVDIATRSSSTTYDAQGRFAIASSNALGHKETRVFDPGFGNPVSLTGPNGLTTYWAYDGFGRKIQENRADGTQSNYAFNFCASNCPANGVYYTTSTASGVPASTVFFDSLNREIRKSTVGFDGRVASVDKVYNSLGQVASTSRPYFPTDTIAWTQFQYDPLGRTVKITEADGGVTQTSYNGLGLSVTNPLNHTTQQVKNGLGQVVQTINARNKLMQFAFDPFGNPVKTLDPNGNTILLAYDIRGRKTAMTDPDMGNWTYAYDVLGEMLRQIDAKGQTTTVSYDVLGRVVKRQEPGLNSAWTWDTAPKGIGKLAAESSDNGFARSYAYDNYGRLVQTTTSISGAGSFYQSTLYDAYGRVSSFTQPTGLSVVNVYNSYGYLSQVLDGTAQKPYWQAQQVDASGRIILERLGNNLYTQRSFDGVGRPTYISTGKFGVTPDIQNLSLNHDQNGNLISRDDYATQRGDSFVYDELDRLTVDLGPNGKILNYQYDELGNINFKTDVGSYFYGAKPHAVTQINGSVYTALQYDANGNQTLGLNNRTVAYTAFNLPSKIVQGTNTVSFDYDSNHERFRQTASNGTTIYLNPRMDLGGHFEQTTSGGVVENRHTVYAAGKAIAEVVTHGSVKQTRYFHTDHLGSIDAVTDDNAIVLARYAFDPFGNRTALYGNLNTINHGFTGHEQLPDVGLIHMNGRVYDPVLARFLSADPSIQAPGNLQSYNRYSYVLNNPLAYTDPSGYSWLSHVWHEITHSQIGRAVLAITVAVTFQYELMPALETLLGYAANSALASASFSTLNAFVGGFAGGVAQTGNLQGGIQGLFNAEMFYGVGFISDPGLNIMGHALIGCVSSEMSGGKCGPGAMSGGFADAAGPIFQTQNFTEQLIAHSVIGGTASVLGGGKFANGAITGAYGYLYNDSNPQHDKNSPYNPNYPDNLNNPNNTLLDLGVNIASQDSFNPKDILSGVVFSKIQDEIYHSLDGPVFYFPNSNVPVNAYTPWSLIHGGLDSFTNTMKQLSDTLNKANNPTP